VISNNIIIIIIIINRHLLKLCLNRKLPIIKPAKEQNYNIKKHKYAKMEE